MADRYSYVPSIGVILLVVWGVYDLTKGWRYQAVAAFAEYVRKHIRDASANLWPKAGLRSRKAKWQPGHFQCNTVEGIDWVVT